MSPTPSIMHLSLASPVPRQRLRGWLFLLLIWQCAAPYCHAHVDSTLPPHQLSTAERLRLALHLQTCHHSDQSVPDDHAWHTHFGLPAAAVPACEVGIEESLSDWGAQLLPPHSLPVGSQPGHGWLYGPAAAAAPPGGFFAAFAPGLAFPVRFCVARL
ncbi:MAG: hypothetical protein RLZZ436_1945 [Planctomycetota bacterium]|jgi:hypothetical protein